MFKVSNQTTQPIPEFPVFNNWNEVALGWYFALPSSDLKVKAVKPIQMCGQELVLFRGEDGKVSALDAFCPHMGTHLGKGKVVGNTVRCFFHHWQFNGDGACTRIPCQDEIPAKARVPSYQVREAFGAVWVYPSSEAAPPLADFPEIPHTEKTTIEFGQSYERTCHHHVTMINGIDPQHLKTVHDIDLEMKIEITEAARGNFIDIGLTGQIGEKKFSDRLARFFLGASYSYAMRYDHGNNGFLTILKDVHFFGRRWPTLHMIFAYRPLEKGRLLVQPIYVTKKRSGVTGPLLSWVLLFLTKSAFHSLQGEDGEVYENMRFYPGNLLPVDRPVSQFIQYVNKLKPSVWKLP